MTKKRKLLAQPQLKISKVQLKKIAKHKKLGKPFTFKLHNILSHFTQKEISEILQDRLLDIAVSDTNSFTGQTISQITMTYQQFMEYEGPLTLYMAQVKINVECPTYISNDCESIQLWCSKGYTDSGWHYDSYDNYLGVIQGVKVVYLSSKCNWMDFEPITSDNYNHAKKGAYIKGKFILLRKDDVLFIPQGMFHRVVSDDNTIGINAWMSGIEKQIVKVGHYQLRYQLSELLRIDIKNELLAYSNQTLKNIDTSYFKEQVKQRKYELNKSNIRTKNHKPLNQQMIIYICLLIKMKPIRMIRFLIQLIALDIVKFIIKLPDMIKMMVAFQLDEFSENNEDIATREQFYKYFQIYEDIIDDLQTIKEKLIKQFAYQILLNHIW